MFGLFFFILRKHKKLCCIFFMVNQGIVQFIVHFVCNSVCLLFGVWPAVFSNSKTAANQRDELTTAQEAHGFRQ